MGIDTSNKGMSTKDKITKLREIHQPVFEKLGVPDAFFVPKMIFGDPKVLLFFRSEMEKGKDIYTEHVSQDYEVQDENRTLYVWKHDPNFESRLNTKPYGQDVMFYIPFSEFEKVGVSQETTKFGIPDPDADDPFSELMIRDLAAILWKKPVSQKPWLNDLIKHNF